MSGPHSVLGRRRNDDGVLLDYGDPGELRAYHLSCRPLSSDQERIAVVQAQHELIVLEIILEHLELSDIATARVSGVLATIRDALQLKCSRLNVHVYR